LFHLEFEDLRGSCSLSDRPSSFSKFLSIYDNGRIIPKNKRLTKEPPSSSASSSSVAVSSAAMALPPPPAAAPASAPKTNPIPKGFDSIYDDLDDVKYDPAIVPMEGITSSQTDWIRPLLPIRSIGSKHIRKMPIAIAITSAHYIKRLPALIVVIT
jgi:hypothetical protein